MIIMKRFIVVVSSALYLSACGGGSSDSEKQLDQEIDRQLIEFCSSLTAEELANNEACQEVLRTRS